MVAQVEIRAGVDALDLLEAEREIVLDIGCCVGVMGQLLVVVETVVFVAEAERKIGRASCRERV